MSINEYFSEIIGKFSFNHNKFCDMIYSSQFKFNDDYVDQFIFSGLPPDEFLGKIGCEAKYQGWHALTMLAQRRIAEGVSDPAFKEKIISHILVRKDRTINSSLFNNNGKPIPAHTNLLRVSDGGLVDVKFLRRIQSKTNIKPIIESIVNFDDIEALKLIESIPFYKDCMEGPDFELSFLNTDLRQGSEILEYLLDKDKETGLSDIVRYVNVINSIGLRDSFAARELYDPLMVENYGYIILKELINNASSNKNGAIYEMITKSVNDGADFYLSFMQIHHGDSIYLDLEGREKDTAKEIRQVIQEWDYVPRLKKSRGILGAIVQGLPTEIRNDIMGDDLISKAIKRACSTSDLRKKGLVKQVDKILTSDLGF